LEGHFITRTKEAIAHPRSDRLDLSKAAFSAAVETTFEIIKKTLEAGEAALLTGFGKFCVRDKEQRQDRNPQTGEDLMLAERRIVTFKCSTVLNRELNGGKG